MYAEPWHIRTYAGRLRNAFDGSIQAIIGGTGWDGRILAETAGVTTQGRSTTRFIPITRIRLASVSGSAGVRFVWFPTGRGASREPTPGGDILIRSITTSSDARTCGGTRWGQGINARLLDEAAAALLVRRRHHGGILAAHGVGQPQRRRGGSFAGLSAPSGTA